MADRLRLKALLVFEPAAAQAAQRVGQGLAAGGAMVSIGTVDTVDPTAAAACDLLLVGARATCFGADGATPADASRFGSVAAWLGALRRRDTDLRADGRVPPRTATTPAFAAAFDIRFGAHRRNQWAASTRASWRLSRLGYELAGLPMGFRLDAVEANLLRGEAERAEAWASGIAMVTAQRMRSGLAVPRRLSAVSAGGPITPQRFRAAYPGLSARPLRSWAGRG